MAAHIITKLTPPDLIHRLRRSNENVRQAIKREMELQNKITVNHIQKARMSGKGPFDPALGRLGVVSGRLRASLRASKLVERGAGGRFVSTFEGAIGSDVQYMGIHEFGGKTKPHIIRPRIAKSLRFQLGGRTIFAKSVNHPGSRMPMRAPISRGIGDRQAEVGAAIANAALQAIEGPMQTGRGATFSRFSSR